MAGRIVIPGDVLGSVEEFRAGAGTCLGGEADKVIFASVAGRLITLPPVAASPAAATGGVATDADARPSAGAGAAAGSSHLPTVMVERPSLLANVAPAVGDVILGVIERITARASNVSIRCVNGKGLRESFDGQIRRENVRATDIDRVEMEKCFRPGDIIQAEVLSLGSKRSYFLSTAKPALGVVSATSRSGHPLAPKTDDMMVCTHSGAEEPRKVSSTGLDGLTAPPAGVAAGHEPQQS